MFWTRFPSNARSALAAQFNGCRFHWPACAGSPWHTPVCFFGTCVLNMLDFAKSSSVFLHSARRLPRLYALFWRMCFTNKFMHAGEDPTRHPGSNEANKKASADARQRNLFVAGINVDGVARCYMKPASSNGYRKARIVTLPADRARLTAGEFSLRFEPRCAAW
jgi:hypothetical protein